MKKFSANALLARHFANQLGVDLLPVLKAVRSHAVFTRVLREVGFHRGGIASLAEAPGYEGASDLAMINIPPMSQMPQVVATTNRCSVSMPEHLLAMQEAAKACHKTMDVLLLVNMGDNREGVEEAELPALLECAMRLSHVRPVGFGSIVGCTSPKKPGVWLETRLEKLVALFQQGGVANPVVSMGGSLFWNWIYRHGKGCITEVRSGDIFILGYDMYANTDLLDGSLQKDVFFLEGEILELTTRESKHTHRKQALVNFGTFHVVVDELTCLVGGVRILKSSSEYTLVDITQSPIHLTVGDTLPFRIVYHTLSKSFFNDATEKIYSTC